MRKPRVLAIGGFDPSGGAGIIADVTTIQASACTACAAVTSITYQRTGHYLGAIHQTAQSLRDQILPLIEEGPILAVKTGMLPTREIVIALVGLIVEHGLPAPVVDPVVRSSSGASLMSNEAIDALLRELMPLARVITPNVPEAERLTGLSIRNETEMAVAAAELRRLGASAVLIKGGHLPNQNPQEAIDLLDDEGTIKVLRSEWISNQTLRGTGCRLASAIAAGIAKNESLEDAVRQAKRFVAKLIESSDRSEPGAVATG
jgi:hydroxymethylpyrimidine kinase/phosphomethylpyrimidine kinase